MDAQPIKPYNNDLYLLANFRFLVSDMGDYTLNLSNPDKMLEWEDVAAVNFPTPNPVQCPICLDSPPLCPQTTTCGHIFCFPCILGYLMAFHGGRKPSQRSQRSQQEEEVSLESRRKGHSRKKKCPYCSTMISCKDLHTVCISAVKQYDVGKHIDFTLLTRAKSSVVPFEKNQHSLGALPHSMDGQCNAFSKFTVTYDPELPASKAALKLTSWIKKAKSEGGEDLELLRYARKQLEKRKKAWTERRASEYLSGSPQLMAEAKEGLSKLKIDSSDEGCIVQSMKIKSGDGITFSYNDSTHYETKRSGSYLNCIANSEQLLAQKGVAKEDDQSESHGVQEKLPKCGDKRESDKGLEIKNLEDIEIKHQHDNTEPVDKDSYSFYQSADGQFLILHPLNMKCLLHHYGTYNLLPSRIRGKILQLETITQSETTRKRYPYLSHFPLTTTFQLCEVDLRKVLPASARPVLPEFTYASNDDKLPSSADFSASFPVLNERYDSPYLRESVSGELPTGSVASASNSNNMETIGVSADSGMGSSLRMSFADIVRAAPKRQISKCQSAI